MANDGTTTRSSGALTTRLNSALQRARDALSGHAHLLSGGTLDELDDLLVELAARRVRIALYGEVKAGKSTLLNAIAGAALSPVAFDPLTSMPLRVTYGEETVWRVGDRVLSSADAVATLMRSEDPTAAEIVVETNLDLLQLGGQVDLVDTPGVGSEDRFDAVTAEALRSLDAAVLVVRYPALFTQVTRRLMDGLQAEMGKLFVVWNLDQACTELTPVERTQHAETLRANVAGAHDLFLVDARSGFEATLRRDAAAIAGSGLGAFTAALGRFVSSAARDLAVVREAAKRADRYLGEARRVLGQRHSSLGATLKEVRGRVQVVQAAADAAADAERAKREQLDDRVTRIAEAHRAAVSKRAEDLRQRLRLARRRWIHGANATALAESAAIALNDHADESAEGAHTTADEVRVLAAEFGARVEGSVPARHLIDLGEIAPEERLQQATSGNFQWIRRALWRRWYLPGLEAVSGSRVEGAASAQNAWVDSLADRALAAARQTSEERLAEIASRAAAEEERIRAAADFTAKESEFDSLARGLPVLQTESASVTQIAAEARSFS